MPQQTDDQKAKLESLAPKMLKLLNKIYSEAEFDLPTNLLNEIEDLTEEVSEDKISLIGSNETQEPQRFGALEPPTATNGALIKALRGFERSAKVYISDRRGNECEIKVSDIYTTGAPAGRQTPIIIKIEADFSGYPDYDDDY